MLSRFDIQTGKYIFRYASFLASKIVFEHAQFVLVCHSFCLKYMLIFMQKVANFGYCGLKLRDPMNIINIYVSQIFFYNCSTAEVLYISGYQALRPVCSRLYHHKEVSLGTKCQKVSDCSTSLDIISIDNSVKLILKPRISLKVPNCKYSSCNPHYVKLIY